MTQASLSPDLPGTLGGSPAAPDAVTPPGHASETAIWMVALTSTALVGSALMLLVLLVQDVVTDASLSGFISGIGLIIAVFGIGGVSYALVMARRAGYIELPDVAVSTVAAAVPAGMHEPEQSHSMPKPHSLPLPAGSQ